MIANSPSGDLTVSERLQNFMTEFPDGKFAAEAEALNAKFAALAKESSDKLAGLLAERNAWADASAKNTSTVYKAFLKSWPDGEHARAAKERIKELGGGKSRRWLMQGAGAAIGSAALCFRNAYCWH